MSTVAASRRGNETVEPKLLTIGTVCESLREEFPDISVSKIRYLEDQGLIAPRRTRGGYRLFSEDDVERLVTILRLQRDEFLPLRVIRQELDGPIAAADRSRRRNVGLTGTEVEIDGAELCERASIAPDVLRALEEFGVVVFRTESGERLYRESEVDIAVAAARLARFGIDARHLRTFLTGAGRQASLVEQLVAPGLRSRSPERRKGAFEDLEALAGVAQELSQLLLLRDLRGVVERAS